MWADIKNVWNHALGKASGSNHLIAVFYTAPKTFNYGIDILLTILLYFTKLHLFLLPRFSSKVLMQ